MSKIRLKARQLSENLYTRDFFFLVITMFLYRLVNGMASQSMPLFIQSGIFNGSKTQAGIANTVFMIAALITRPFIGKLMERFGRKIFYIIGIIITTISTVFFGFIASFPLLLLLRGISGVGFAFQGTSSATMNTDVIPESRLTEGIGFSGLSQSLSAAVAPGLAIALIGSMDYKSVFLIIGSISLITLFFTLFINSEKYRKEKEKSVVPATDNKKSLSQISQKPINNRFLRFIDDYFALGSLTPASIVFLIDIGGSSISTFLATYALSIGVKNIGLFFTAQAITLALTRLFIKKLLKLCTARIMAPMTLIIMCLTYVGLFFAKSIYIFIALGAVYGLASGVQAPIYQTLCVKGIEIRKRGIANSTYQMSRDLGLGLGAALWGVAADVFTVRYVFIIAPIFLIIALVVSKTYFSKSVNPGEHL